MDDELPFSNLVLRLLSSHLAICRLPPDSAFPEWAWPGEILALVRTHSELSIVCEERFVPPEAKAERGWQALKVEGKLDFSLTGVLASIAAPLASAGISIFVISTFDTDYILVKEAALERSLAALGEAGFPVSA